jgi:hypothetical protein
MKMLSTVSTELLLVAALAIAAGCGATTTDASDPSTDPAADPATDPPAAGSASSDGPGSAPGNADDLARYLPFAPATASGDAPMVLIAGQAAARAASATGTQMLVQQNQPPAPTADGRFIQCVGPFSIRSEFNGAATSAELDYAGGDFGMARARAFAIGPWEKWDVCQDPTNLLWSFRAHGTGLIVSTELGYVGGNHFAMLRARASVIGPWEQIRPLVAAGAIYAFVFPAANAVTSAEFAYPSPYDNGVLRARNATIGPWEQFFFVVEAN